MGNQWHGFWRYEAAFAIGRRLQARRIFEQLREIDDLCLEVGGRQRVRRPMAPHVGTGVPRGGRACGRAPAWWSMRRMLNTADDS